MGMMIIAQDATMGAVSGKNGVTEQRCDRELKIYLQKQNRSVK